MVTLNCEERHQGANFWLQNSQRLLSNDTTERVMAPRWSCVWSQGQLMWVSTSRSKNTGSSIPVCLCEDMSSSVSQGHLMLAQLDSCCWPFNGSWIPHLILKAFHNWSLWHLCHADSVLRHTETCIAVIVQSTQLQCCLNMTFQYFRKKKIVSSLPIVQRNTNKKVTQEVNLEGWVPRGFDSSPPLSF